MFLLSGFIFIILAPFTFADVCEPCGFNINEIVEIHGAGLACDEEHGELTAEERLDCMVTKLSDKFCRSQLTHNARKSELDNAKVVAGNSFPPSFPPVHPFA